MRMGAAGAGLAAAGSCLWTCCRGLKRLCRVLAVGNCLLDRGNVGLVRSLRGSGKAVAAVPVAIAAEIEVFSVWEGERDGTVCAGFNLLSGENFIAFYKQATASIW
nr:hypothetical protein [Kluyvera genomosp. 2]